MNKWFNKYAIVILSILIADLLSLYALNVLNHFRANSHPYQSAAITMAVAVGIFYPTLKFLEKYLKNFSGKIMKQSTKVAGNHLVGRLVGFVFALLILWLGYTHAIYNSNPFADAKKWVVQKF